MVFKITVKTLDSHNYEFEADDDWTVKQLKESMQETIGVSAEEQRLIFCGRVLLDDKKLTEYDCNGKVIHLVRRPPPPLVNPDQTASAASVGSTPQSSTSSSGLRPQANATIVVSSEQLQSTFQFPISLGPINLGPLPHAATTGNVGNPSNETNRSTSEQARDSPQQSTTSNSTQTTTHPVRVVSGRLPFDFFLPCLSPWAVNASTNSGPGAQTQGRIHVSTARHQTATPGQGTGEPPRTQTDPSTVTGDANRQHRFAPPNSTTGTNPLGELVSQLFMGGSIQTTAAPSTGQPSANMSNDPDSFINIIPEIALNAASQILGGVLGIPAVNQQTNNQSAGRQPQTGGIVMDIEIDDSSSSQSESRYHDARESQSPNVTTTQNNNDSNRSTSLPTHQVYYRDSSRPLERTPTSDRRRLETILQNHPDWISIIEADINFMESRTASSNNQRAFSDAYLSSIPRKRRRVLTTSPDRVPVLHASPSQAISNLLRRAITNTNVPNVESLDQILISISSDADLQTAYEDYIKTAVMARLTSDSDYCPQKFENSSKYFK